MMMHLPQVVLVDQEEVALMTEIVMVCWRFDMMLTLWVFYLR